LLTLSLYIEESRKKLSGQEFFQIIQMVQNANDIVDVIGEHVALKKAGKNFQGLCPFHREKTPSFSVSQEKQFYKCFGCGAGGDVIKFVQNILKVDFKEAIEFLARRGGVTLPEKTYSKQSSGSQGPSKIDILKANQWACDYYSSILWDSPIGADGRNYLAKRGLTTEICKKFKVGFAPPSGMGLLEAAGKKRISSKLLEVAGLATNKYGSPRDLFRGRVLFPIFDATGSVVGFGGRTLGDDQPKYLNTAETPVFQKQKNLFGLYFAREAIQEKKQVVVVEGYTDCMAPFQVGIGNVVATLGTALTEQHVQILRRYAEEIVLIFDADQAGQKAADRALNVFLSLGVDVKLSSVTSGKDPCDLVMSEGATAMQAVIDSAVGALDYKWRQLQRKYNVGNEGEKRAAIDDLLTTLASCDPYGRVDVIQKGMLISRLASMLSIPAEQIHRMLQKYRRKLPNEGVQEPQKTVMEMMPVSETPAHSALKDILEVLICEPGYLSSVSERLSPEDFEPEVFRKIADHLWFCYNQLGEFTLSELIGVVEEPILADIITQLYKEGTRKGNFAQTLEDSMRCLNDYRHEAEATQIAASMNLSDSEDETDKQLQMLYEKLKSSVRRIPGALAE
jgi:DNA primase